MRRRTLWLLSLLLVLDPHLLAEERIDAEMNARIRQEARDRSQIMRTLHFLTDVYGPRLTGSPNHRAAADWALKQMAQWGLQNGHLEPWDFGHPGWANERFTAHIVSPVHDALVGEVLAWTSSTNGPVNAEAVLITPAQPSAGATADTRQGVTRPELTAYLESVRGTVKGRIVLVGRPQQVPVSFNPPPLRRDFDQVRAQYDPSSPANTANAPAPAANATPRDPDQLTAVQIADAVDQFLLDAGALVRVNDAGRDHGQIRAFNNRTYDPAKMVPTVILRNEDYGRIGRILADGTPVRLEIDIVNRFYPEGRTSYNTIAEIPGTDRKDEVVMLGGHLDSWHAATGATDNAIGCAVMMEAARILTALGVRPRRTIRVALWSGEEQGLLGSKVYVQEHFGSYENRQREFPLFAGYFNVDAGTGRIRGATVFGPPEAATVLRDVLAPFEDLGVAGAIATRSRRAASTDSTSFNEAGLPGITLGQDPIEYGTYTWHTNLDTYERVVEEDARKSAIEVAAAVYHLAMRDEMLPRFTGETMPAAR